MLNRINCALKIEDKDFREVLKGMLIYSGLFNVLKDYDEEVLLLWDEIEPLEIDDNNIRLLKVNSDKCFSELLARIEAEYAMERGFNLSPQFGIATKIKRIGVYSAKGGSGSSLIAKSIAKVLYRSGYKPLVLDLSPLALNESTLGMSESKMDLANLLFNVMRGRKINVEGFAENIDGVSFIRRGVINSYTETISDEILKILTDAAAESGFDVFIFDYGNHLSSRHASLLKKMDSAVCVLPMNMEWIKNGMPCIEELLRLGPIKTVKVLNDASGMIEEDGYRKIAEKMKVKDLIIPYYGVITDRSIDGEFGNEIRFLADEVLGRNYA